MKVPLIFVRTAKVRGAWFSPGEIAELPGEVALLLIEHGTARRARADEARLQGRPAAGKPAVPPPVSKLPKYR
jgi:hypothetical protein